MTFSQRFLKSVNAIFGWWQPFLGDAQPFKPKEGKHGNTTQSELPPKMDGHHPERTVTINRGRSSTSKPMLKCLSLTPPYCLLNILAWNWSGDWVKVNFVIAWRGLLKNVQNFYSTHPGSWEIRCKTSPFFETPCILEPPLFPRPWLSSK